MPDRSAESHPPGADAAAALERNLRLYAWYQPLTHAYFWTPVFFLFFSERFPIDEILQLQSLYYLSVVALEVPSGYLSDRVSRVAVLRWSALAGACAYAGFVFGGSSYAIFAAAQIALAVSYSFISGTDVAFHYDSLVAVRREETFGAREALIQSRGLYVTSASVLVGGAAGFVDLRIAYALSLATQLAIGGVVLAMREPPRESRDPLGFAPQLAVCARYLRTPALAWLFAFVVLQTSLEHVPYEFTQPYLATLLGERVTASERTPIVAGAVSAVIAFVAALAAANSVRLRGRFGLTRVLLGVTALQTVIIGAMGAVFNALVVPLVLLRSCYPAIGKVLVHAAVTPRVPQQQRATYLSMHSLAGRLGYGALLLGLSGVGAGEPNDPATVATMLRWCLLLAVAGLAALAMTRGSLGEDPPRSGTGPDVEVIS